MPDRRKSIVPAPPHCDGCGVVRDPVLPHAWHIGQRRVDWRTVEYYLLCGDCLMRGGVAPPRTHNPGPAGSTPAHATRAFTRSSDQIPGSTNVAAARLAVRVRFTAGKGRHFESAGLHGTSLTRPGAQIGCPPHGRAPGHLPVCGQWCPWAPRAVHSIGSASLRADTARGLLSYADCSGSLPPQIGGPQSSRASAVTVLLLRVSVRSCYY